MGSFAVKRTGYRMVTEHILVRDAASAEAALDIAISGGIGDGSSEFVMWDVGPLMSDDDATDDVAEELDAPGAAAYEVEIERSTRVAERRIAEASAEFVRPLEVDWSPIGGPEEARKAPPAPRLTGFVAMVTSEGDTEPRLVIAPSMEETQRRVKLLGESRPVLSAQYREIWDDGRPGAAVGARSAQKVWVAVVHNRDGNNISAHQTERGAVKFVAAWARDALVERYVEGAAARAEADGMDDGAVIDYYFEQLSPTNEYYDIEGVYVDEF